MAPKLVIKNTFLCAFDDDEASPVNSALQPRRRAQSLPPPVSPPIASSVEGKPPSLDAPWICARAAESAQAHLPRGPPTDARLAAGVRGRVLDAARSPQGHVVLLDLIRRLPVEDVAFVAAELRGSGLSIASNVYGHIVLCRLVEYSAEHPMTVELVDEVIDEGAEALCCHKFGFCLAMSVLSNGSQRQRRRIIAALSTHVQRFARHRFASQVLEHAIVAHHETDECQRLLPELLRHSSSVAKLACHCFGIRVVRALLLVPETSKYVRSLMRQAEQRLRKDRYGAQLLEDLDDTQGAFVSMAPLFGA
mmetsp:Transcript_8680/g.24851  ORF Transcript_8680/g.24851 Transcript_8680/m.24851 type:complete len:307 (+) Transcript_8680:86-1006(+)